MYPDQASFYWLQAVNQNSFGSFQTMQIDPLLQGLLLRRTFPRLRPSNMTKPIRFKLFIMMALEIAIWGAWQVQIFNYMPMLGFEGWQQNLAGSMFAIASVVGIFFSNQFADRNFAAEKFLSFSHLIGGVALVGAAFAQSFGLFFACFLLYGLFYVPTISVTNSLAFANLPDPAKDFGFVRMGGTIGWIVVSWPFIFLLSGRSTVQEMRWIFLGAAIISFVLAAYSLTLPHTPPRRDVEGIDHLAWVKAVKFLAVPYVLVLFIVTLIDSIIHNGYFVLIGGFLKSINMPDNWIMAVTTIGQVAEIVTMVILGSVLKKIGWKWTMLLGILGHALRFLVFAFFGKPEYQALIIVVQVLHGICYAFFFATLYIFVDAVFPKDIRTSAQGLFNLLILGVGLVIANFWFGSLKGKLTVDGVTDYHRLFLVPTGLAVLAMLLLLVFFKPPAARPQETGTAPAPH
jgi:nucleoside transporter